MIKLCENAAELEFLPADPFAARITALFDTYGAGCGFALFWVQSVDGVPSAAMSRVDGCMTLCCRENADIDEIAEFIGFCGCSDLLCEREIMEALGIEPQSSSFIMRFEGLCEPAEAPTGGGIPDMRRVHALLLDCGFEVGDYNSFAADVCARLNKGTARLVTAEDGGELCACAFALFIGHGSTLLGAVATDPRARGRGCASRLVKALAAEQNGRAAFVFCRSDGLEKFYKKCGFCRIGKWATARLHD